MTQSSKKNKLLARTSPPTPLYASKTLQLIFSGLGHVFWAEERLRPSVASHLLAATNDWPKDLPHRIEVFGLDLNVSVKKKFEEIGPNVKFIQTEGEIPSTVFQTDLIDPLRICFVLTPDRFHVAQVLEFARKFSDAIIVVEKPVLILASDANHLRALLESNSFQGKLISLEHYVAKESFLALMHKLQTIDAKLTPIDELRICLCEHKDDEGRDVSPAYLDLSVHCLLMAVQVFRQTRNVVGPIQIQATEATLYEHSESGGTAAEGRFTISSEGCATMRLEFVAGKKTIDLKTLRVMSDDVEIAGLDFLRDKSNAHEFMFNAIMHDDTSEGFVATHDSIDACEVIADAYSNASRKPLVKYCKLWPFQRNIESFLPEDPA